MSDNPTFGRYAEIPVDRMTPEQREGYRAGLPAAFPDAREQLVYEVAMALAGDQLISQGLHDRAVRVLGHESITDMIVLMGYYTAVSLTMNFYAVPAGSPGLAR
jgi:4-carboxymuconolactone decarboxylase